MLEKQLPPPVFDPALLPQLACPACHSDLHLNASRLICAECRRAYPVIDGIPVLIVERAENLVDQSKGEDPAPRNP
ncbi:conserved hypothetical protein [Candidatus Sulfotelmatomonas gaucii]|uniref:UPF0434 protein SBA5_30133 n=1 Tax=Candidatus Sulfuritelmatomonas gaucii TaxID=2043161 RepID=A0A2N9LCF2_9BACT|nr:conserved hypothetical protein [Candidatus Sulfotelmatomonas gaucii]